MAELPRHIPLSVRLVVDSSWQFLQRDASALVLLLWPWLLALSIAKIVSVVAVGMPEWFLFREGLQSLLHRGGSFVGMITLLPIQTTLVRWAAAGPQEEVTLGQREVWFFLVGTTGSMLFFLPSAIALTFFVVTNASINATAWVLPLLILPLLPVIPRLMLAAASAATGETRFDLVGA
ncbi:MAG: hypothetical protein HQL91_07015 [Magnetococcales bacterium]|nr:hypothetical protein [Magnetococcales bacterium]